MIEQSSRESDHPVGNVGGDAGGVEVDRVWHWGLVDDRDAYKISHADVDDRARNGAAESPAVVGHSFRDLQRRFLDRDAEFLYRRISNRRYSRVVRRGSCADDFVEIDADDAVAAASRGKGHHTNDNGGKGQRRKYGSASTHLNSDLGCSYGD